MIRFELTPEPQSFDRECRKPGCSWLIEHSDADRPKDYWSPFRQDLAMAFRNLCAYSAMLDFNGTVDHFVSWAASRKIGQHQLAYEWSNLRYCSGWINTFEMTNVCFDNGSHGWRCTSPVD